MSVWKRHVRGAVLMGALCASVGCRSLRDRTKRDAGSDASSGLASASPHVEDAAVGAEAGVDAGVNGALYTSVAGRFRVRFPDGKAPEVENVVVRGHEDVHVFSVRYGTSGYLVVYDDRARAGRSAEQVLDAARDGVLETTGGDLESARELSQDRDRVAGREIAVSLTTSGIQMRQRVRLFVADGRLYQVIVLSPFWSGATDVEQAFLDSFVITSEGAK